MLFPSPSPQPALLPQPTHPHPYAPPPPTLNHHHALVFMHVLSFLFPILLFFSVVAIYEFLALKYEDQPQPQDIEQRVPRNPPQAGPINLAGGQVAVPREVSATVVIYRNHGKIENCCECAICLEDFREGQLCKVLDRCKHMYHIACIDKWLTRDKHCPLCRGSVLGAAHSNNQNQI